MGKKNRTERLVEVEEGDGESLKGQSNMQHIHSHSPHTQTLTPTTYTHEALTPPPCPPQLCHVHCVLPSSPPLPAHTSPSAVLASLVLRPRLLFLVLVWCLVVVGAFAHLHVHQLTFLSAVSTVPLSIVHCAVSIVTHTLSKLSYRRYHQRLLLLLPTALALALSLSPFYSLSPSLSLSVALSGSPRLQLAKGHRVRFVISASNKTHPFANTRRTLDTRHPRYPLDMGQGHAVQQ